ncbi:CAP domain-containing protein [Streptomyces althioticus]|uniref:CAP domain-containing protein n=2 Tax=Actinomycetes TaxID=1760 RepID=A0ABZ1YD26_9ACTN|nr:CAP domain-containing protein [Streptomyces althioticus]WTC26760.1 CAP domain-containing protein [Streptomyces althioticus]
MSELVPGGNIPLPGGAVTVRVPGPFDVSALITDDGRKVSGDADFVFYNQPSAPGARLGGDTLVVDPAALRTGATRVTVAVSPEEPGTPLSALPAPVLEVTGPGGRALARFRPPRPDRETVLLLAEVYRRGDGWKLRALGQGYADGLAGLARDFGVDVEDDEGAVSTRTAPVVTGRAPVRPATLVQAAPRTLAAVPPRPAAPPSAGDDFLALVNSARRAAGSPPVSHDGRLAEAARQHARAMARGGRLGVEGPDGVPVYRRVVAAGYPYLTVGEHLVSGPLSVDRFVGHCLRHEAARRTVCDPAFTHAAVASCEGRGDTYWTALWARPLTPEGLDRTTAEVVELTNRERARAGLPALSRDPLLTTAARAHSADMVARDFYAHTAPDGSKPWDRAAAAGSRCRTVGENIACGQRSAAEVVRGWMNSPGHRANILKPEFTHIGVGFAGGGRAGTYWTQLFGG